jgi:predicted RNA-binding Zn-ribbon protein involved in translation (DUF1610 family)
MNKNKNNKKAMGKLSQEQLSHFRCGFCDKWWSIGDAPKKNKWFCPWCGKEQIFKNEKTGNNR